VKKRKREEVESVKVSLMNHHGNGGRGISNGSGGKSKGRDDGKLYKFDEVDLTRLIIQSLKELGYEKSAKEVENESKIKLTSDSMKEFEESIIKGKWEESIGILRNKLLKNEDIEVLKFLILQQEYFELLYNDDSVNALTVLKKLKNCKSVHIQDLGQLASFIACSNVKSLKKCVSTFLIDQNRRLLKDKKKHRLNDSFWEPIEYRKDLFATISQLLPPTLMVPKGRLNELLSESVQYKLQENNSLIDLDLDEPLPLLEDSFYQESEVLVKESNRKASTSEVVLLETAHILKGHTDEVWCVDINATKSLVASGSKDRSIIIWDPKNDFNKVKKIPLAHKIAVEQVKFNPNPNYVHLLLSSGGNRSIKLWSTASCTLLYKFNQHFQPVTSIKWMAGGENFLSTGMDKLIVMCDAESCQIVKSWNTHERIVDICITKDKENHPFALILYADGFIDSKYLLDIPETSQLPKIGFVDNNIKSIQLSNQIKDHECIIARQEDAVSIISTKDNTVLKKITAPKMARFIVKNSVFQNNYLLLGSESGSIDVIDLSSLDFVTKLKGHAATVNEIASSDDYFITASDDFSLRVWR
jgi:WD40 repeat protein